MLTALQGVRVLDLTRILAGPFATMLLADLGADVVKLERPDGGDETRAVGPFFEGESAYFVAMNRSKRSVAIDVGAGDGRRLLDALADASDVLVHNFRPSVARKLGCDAARMTERAPRLIVCAMSACGEDDPGSEAPAFDLTLQARGGTMSITGEPGRAPVRMGPPIGDLAGALYAALAVSAALVERSRTGRGQTIDLSLLDCQASLLVYAASFYLNAGVLLGPQGSAHARATPYQTFPTADREIAVAVFTERFWPGFCRAVGVPAWASDPRFATAEARKANHAAWLPEAEGRLASAPSATWLDAMAREGVPCSAVQNVAEVCRDPAIVAREMLADLGGARVMGNPMKLAGWRGERHGPAPKLGEHTDVVLREWLGMRDAEIAALRANRTLASPA